MSYVISHSSFVSLESGVWSLESEARKRRRRKRRRNDDVESDEKRRRMRRKNDDVENDDKMTTKKLHSADQTRLLSPIPTTHQITGSSPGTLTNYTSSRPKKLDYPLALKEGCTFFTQNGFHKSNLNVAPFQCGPVVHFSIFVSVRR